MSLQGKLIIDIGYIKYILNQEFKKLLRDFLGLELSTGHTNIEKEVMLLHEN